MCKVKNRWVCIAPFCQLSYGLETFQNKKREGIKIKEEKNKSLEEKPYGNNKGDICQAWGGVASWHALLARNPLSQVKEAMEREGVKVKTVSNGKAAEIRQ